jgi:peptide deformylase
MIHPILLYGDPLLKQKSGDIPKNFPKLAELVNDMFKTMAAAHGVGLAAIQIGIPLKIFVIDAHLPDENFHFRGVFINPYIRRRSAPEIKYSEGCLSIPFISAMVERPSKIEMEYYDDNWNFRVETFDGYKARIIQHEYDHLEGELFTEKVDGLWMKVIEPSLVAIKEREIQVPYLSK